MPEHLLRSSQNPTHSSRPIWISTFPQNLLPLLQPLWFSSLRVTEESKVKQSLTFPDCSHTSVMWKSCVSPAQLWDSKSQLHSKWKKKTRENKGIRLSLPTFPHLFPLKAPSYAGSQKSYPSFEPQFKCHFFIKTSLICLPLPPNRSLSSFSEDPHSTCPSYDGDV